MRVLGRGNGRARLLSCLMSLGRSLGLDLMAASLSVLARPSPAERMGALPYPPCRPRGARLHRADERKDDVAQGTLGTRDRLSISFTITRRSRTPELNPAPRGQRRTGRRPSRRGSAGLCWSIGRQSRVRPVPPKRLHSQWNSLTRHGWYAWVCSAMSIRSRCHTVIPIQPGRHCGLSFIVRGARSRFRGSS